MTKLEKAVYKTLFHCFDIKPEDSLCILIDRANRELGQIYLERALRAKLEAILLEIPPLDARMPEPSSKVMKIVTQFSAVLTLTASCLIYSNLVQHVRHNGVRIICINQPSQESLERAINVDYDFIKEKSQRIADILSIGKQVDISAKNGTKITFKTIGHTSRVNIGLAQLPGEFGILPAGEAAITPDQKGSEGIIVIDGSVPGIGLIRNPLEIQVKNGYASQIFGGSEAEKLRRLLRSVGKKSRNVAELGIGTNPNAILSGTTSEDKKVLGTAHVGLGKPEFASGNSIENFHLDLVIKKPTVSVEGYPILKNGKLVL